MVNNKIYVESLEPSTDNADLCKITRYLYFNRVVGKWYCSLIEEEFKDISYCKECMVGKDCREKVQEKSMTQVCFTDFLDDDGLLMEKDDCEYIDLSEEEIWAMLKNKMPNRNIKSKP